MSVITETTHTGEFLVAELPGLLSRALGTLNAGQDLAAGTVLGQILTAGAATAVGSPTGTGAITVGAIGPAAVAGVYKLVCVAAASNAGTFNFYTPSGVLIRQITVAGGAAANDHIVITIADATDFIVGDTFSITVAAGEYEILDPAEDDGAQIAAAILYGAVDATSADQPCTVVTNNAAVELTALVWPAGISVGNKAIALASLAKRGIVTR